MALDRANYYPPANRTIQDFSGSGPMSAPDKVVWHSTEVNDWSSYNAGKIAPHLTVKPDFTAKRLVWRQHFPFSQFGKSLVNKPGGVETNRDACIQVEIVGTCDPPTHRKWAGVKHLYMPELPDWAVRDLAEFAAWCNDHHGVPYKAPTFKPYPASYGATATRFTFTEWRGFTGHCGHQHVPESEHGDPGSLPINDILAAARRLNEEDDMPSIDDIRKAIREEVRAALTEDKLVENIQQPWEAKQFPPMSVAAALSNIERDTDTPPAIAPTPNTPPTIPPK